MIHFTCFKFIRIICYYTCLKLHFSHFTWLGAASRNSDDWLNVLFSLDCNCYCNHPGNFIAHLSLWSCINFKKLVSQLCNWNLYAEGIHNFSSTIVHSFFLLKHTISYYIWKFIPLTDISYILQFSKSITSEEGKKLGLVDALVPKEELLKVSRQWALDIAEGRKPWIRSLHRIDKLGSLPEVHDIIKLARQQVKQVAKNMPQHQACLDVIEEGIIHGGYHGILKVTLFSGTVCWSSYSNFYWL